MFTVYKYYFNSDESSLALKAFFDLVKCGFRVTLDFDGDFFIVKYRTYSSDR